MTSTKQIVPVSFADALTAQGKDTTPNALFSLAYAWGSKQAIPEKALRNVWPDSSIADDRVASYLDDVYFIQYCALQYWENADSHAIAEEWRTKGMNTWGKILSMVDSPFKRYNTDWLYIVSRATIDGKQDKESTNKVIKPASRNAFRKRVEMLVGMALNGFVFTNPLESLEAVQQTRAKKAEEAAAKETKKAEKEAEKAAKQTAAKKEAPAPKKAKQATAKKSKAQKPAIDELPPLDNIFDDVEIPGESIAV